MKFWTAFVLAALGTASATAQEVQTRDGRRPEVGVRATAVVGNAVFEEFRYTVVIGAAPTQAVRQEYPRSSVRIAAGTRMIPVVTGAQLKVCTVDNSYYNGEEPTERACLLDDDGDRRFDRVARNDVARAHPLQAPVPYELTDVPLPETTGSFRRVITYLGATSDTLRLSYREFANDMARPAFTEEFTFPIRAAFPQIVVFRNVRMTVLGIDGEGLHYQINSVAPSEPQAGNK